MTDIAIYVEGGGDSAQQRAELRQGFDGLLSREKAEARQKRLGWKVIPSGGRTETYEAFIDAVRTEPHKINVLLVDSEAEIAIGTGEANHDAKELVTHLAKRDGWEFSEVCPERVHLMVQCMEAWIVADVAALAKYYGQGFAPKTLPQRKNLEEEPKELVYEKLAKATCATQKGERVINKSHLPVLVAHLSEGQHLPQAPITALLNTL